ncbi:M15 family metallopeptidase [Thiothrix nivea]|uniref:Peptidoglycan-binding domain 1 protein n=1 Tax=Thiothrix nivea (strain ATCC 35100 / DSM 5205 / JP2) TaxID=870187 RepID=A0A656HDT8_THINJ|nr:M15 family metallopeptidase [Thiothrix nivea]EIJ33349.1 Peptidoglycan-binding domain 1 protein [Thiothrix nivea DSM 5205]
MASVKEVQEALAALGLYLGAIDDVWGEMTEQAVIAFQRINRLTMNGKISTKLLDMLFSDDMEDRAAPPERDDGRPEAPGNPARWPSGNPDSLECYFGAVGTDQVRIKTAYPLRLAWDLNTIMDGFSCHRLVADPMEYIFRETLAHYGQDKVHDLRLDRFGGCLNVRKIRGGNYYSTHAWGIAVDIDPANNRLDWGKSKASLAKPEYNAWWEIIESTGAQSLGRRKNYDWMHFQFAKV